MKRTDRTRRAGSGPVGPGIECNAADKRRLARFRHDAGVLYSFWKTDRFFPGRLSDFNQSGLRLRTPYRLRVGSLIFVVAEDSDRTCPCSRVRKGCLSEIVWVRHSRTPDRYKFMSGLRFVETDPGGAASP